MAGGLRLKKDKLPAFARDFAAFCRSILRPEDLLPSLRIDAEASLAELSMPVVDQIARLAPFGQGNPAPMVALRNCRILSPPQRMGRTGATISFLASQNGTAERIRCVGFNMGQLPDKLMGVQTVDLAGKPMVNTYNGRSSPELHITDVAWD
jgi:single-stranded-DNA-specific exonuclease